MGSLGECWRVSLATLERCDEVSGIASVSVLELDGASVAVKVDGRWGFHVLFSIGVWDMRCIFYLFELDNPRYQIYISSSTWHLFQSAKCPCCCGSACTPHGGGHSTHTGLGSDRQRAAAGFRITASRDCLGVLRVLTVQRFGNPQDPTIEHRYYLAPVSLDLRYPLKQGADDILGRDSPNPTQTPGIREQRHGLRDSPPKPPISDSEVPTYQRIQSLP